MGPPVARPERFASLAAKFDPANLRLRLLSAGLLMPLALLGIYAGSWPYVLAVMLCMAAGLHEWLAMVAKASPRRVMLVAQGGLLLVLGLCAWQSPTVGAAGAVVASLAILLTAYRRGSLPESGWGCAAWSAMGLPYLAVGGAALLALRELPEIGLALTCFLFVTVWATDIGAFAAGRLIGGPKLCPKISPKKTWAGLFGGMAFAGAFGYAVAEGFGAAQPLLAAGIGMMLTLVAQIGDLFESWVKRRFGVKDSGALIPGHGGVLDRIDGLLFAAPVFAAFQAAFGPDLRWW